MKMKFFNQKRLKMKIENEISKRKLLKNFKNIQLLKNKERKNSKTELFNSFSLFL